MSEIASSLHVFSSMTCCQLCHEGDLLLVHGFPYNTCRRRATCRRAERHGFPYNTCRKRATCRRVERHGFPFNTCRRRATCFRAEMHGFSYSACRRSATCCPVELQSKLAHSREVKLQDGSNLVINWVSAAPCRIAAVKCWKKTKKKTLFHSVISRWKTWSLEVLWSDCILHIFLNPFVQFSSFWLTSLGTTSSTMEVS